MLLFKRSQALITASFRLQTLILLLFMRIQSYHSSRSEAEILLISTSKCSTRKISDITPSKYGRI